MPLKQTFEYRVVGSGDLKHMADQVAECMGEGWHCQGGVYLATGDEGTTAFQAMIRVQEIEEMLMPKGRKN